MEFQGGTPKIEENHGFSKGGGQCKKIENSRGVTVNLTGNPRGFNKKKNQYPHKGVQFLSGKVQFS